MITSIKELTDLYTSVYYLEDTSVIPLVVATVIANRLPGAPVWLMLVGASSAGKSEIINAITDLEINGQKKIFQVSSLTENTFLSGLVRDGKNASLLHRIGNRGVIVMKDFTTQLSQRQERASEIFSQLREIYDGTYTKETGMGVPLKWEGRLNFIGGVTEKIFQYDKLFGGMGTRAVNYLLPKVSRKEFTRRSLRNNANIDKYRAEVRKGFHDYINHLVKRLETCEIPAIPADHNENIIDVVDFATLCRSSTERGFRGILELVQSPEMPGRMANQMMQLSTAFMLMEDEPNNLSDYYRKIVYRVGFDSIPLGRIMALREAARFQSIKTSIIATKLGYPTDTVREWMEDLNVFNVIERIKDGSGVASGDSWIIKPEFRDLMVKFDGIEVVEDAILDEDKFTDLDMGEVREHNERIDNMEL